MIDSGTLFVILFVGGLLLAFSMVVLLHILHFILPKKYDALLFKEPIFNKTELTILRIWPYSLIRTTGYILLLTVPNFYITKKRFKDITIDRSNVFLLTLFSRLYLFIAILTVLFGIGLMIMALVGYLISTE